MQPLASGSGSGTDDCENFLLREGVHLPESESAIYQTLASSITPLLTREFSTMDERIQHGKPKIRVVVSVLQLAAASAQIHQLESGIHRAYFGT